MNISQNRPKIADTACSKYQNFWYLSPDGYKPKKLTLQAIIAQSIRNSDTAVQININQIEPKIAETSCSKYQKFWYLSPDKY